MRTLYDVYNIDECGEIASTPANTIGMGNPMLPTAEEPGTEPLMPTAKTKTEKKQKKQKVKDSILSDNEIKESILADMDDTLQVGDDVVEFANWYADNLLTYFTKFTKNELLNALITMISFENKNTVVIDISKDETPICSSLIIKNPNIPRNVKTIKYVNMLNKTKCIFVGLYVGNVANINIEAYRDNGKSYGNIELHAHKSAGQHLMLGKLTCNTLDIDFKGDSLSINNDSIILELSLKHSYNLTNLYAKLPHITSATVCKKLIQRQLSEAGIWPWGVKLDIR